MKNGSYFFAPALAIALFALLLTFGAPGARAADDLATISWTVPTARTDGTPLSANELAEYVFSCRPEVGEHVDLLTIPGDLSQYQAPRVELFAVSGDYWCAMRVTDTGGLSSEKSDEVLVQHRARPGGPGNVIIEGDLLVKGNLTVQGTVRVTSQ